MHYLGIAIGGTKCIVVLGKEENQSMQLLGSRRFPTAQGCGPYEVLEKLALLGDELLREFGLSRPDAVGIACGGPLSAQTGRILSPPNLLGWDNIPVVEIMSRHFGVPAFLDNDANGGALAEWRFGAAQGAHHAIFLTFGTGFGSGLILNDRLYRGGCDLAGECGHVRLAPFGPVGFGKSGSAEGFCSGGGIAQLAQSMCREQLQLGKKPPLCPSIDRLPELTAKSVAEAAYAGDPLARQIYALSGEMLGRMLALLIDLFNPDVIAIGSIFARSESLLRPSMEAVLQAEAIPAALAHCRIVPAALGDEIDMYEALSIASYEMNV